MSEDARKLEKYGPIVIAVAVAGSAVVVGGWYLLTNRGGAGTGGVDASGFDIASAPTTRRTTAPSTVGDRPAAQSGLGMVKLDESMIAGNAAAPPAPAAAPAAPDPKAAAAASFRESVLKNEKTVEEFGRRMEKQYPSLTQYAKDWNSYPDLKALGLAWRDDKDPVKFITGVVKSDNFGKTVQKYAGDPGVRAFLVEGVKNAPSDLLSSAGGMLQNDHAVKDLALTVAKAAGLPPSITAMIGTVDSKTQVPDASKVLSEVMSDPNTQKAMRDQQTPVAAPRR